MAANHETGVLQPLEQVALIAHELGATLHVDAVQALGKLPPESWRFADSLALAAHKIRQVLLDMVTQAVPNRRNSVSWGPNFDRNGATEGDGIHVALAPTETP